MANIFSSPADEKAQLLHAMLNPLTEEAMQLYQFERTAKFGAIGLTVVLLLLVVLTIYRYKQNKKLLLVVWTIYISITLTIAVIAKEKLEELNSKANIAFQVAVEKAMKVIAEENADKKIFDTPLQIENKQLFTSEQIKELMPKAPVTRNIDLNCSSVSSGYATCSGTVTDR